MVESVLSGASSQGAQTEIFYLGDLKVNPCNVCNSCETTGECVQKDDMQLIYDALKGTNIIVFGTPIYHDHVSAQAKILTDRLYAYEWKSSFPQGVKAVVIITYEWDNPNGYDNVVEWIKETFKRYYGIETIAVLRAYNTTKTPVAQRPESLREAKAIGEKMV